MFENIIGQPVITELIKKQIQMNRLPNSMLFYGPNYTAKLSTALEVARSLNCEGSAEWGCNCHSCHLHRLLVNPLMIITGPRYFDLEIRASANTLQRVNRFGTRYLFIRAVRKLLRRFDPVLWKGEEESLSKWRERIEEIEESLSIFEPFDISDEVTPNFERNVKKIVDLSLPLCEIANKRTISINQIRSIAGWLNIKTGNERKVVILENADSMQESAMNSVLKILEEPPDNVFFILITTKKSGIYSTILSRLWQYYFPKRERKSESVILDKIFKENPEDYKGLKDYFEFWHGADIKLLRESIEGFLRSFWVKEADNVLNDNIFSAKIFETRGNVLIFLEELLEFIRMLYVDNILNNSGEVWNKSISVKNISRVTRVISDAYYEIGTLNIKPSLVIESLYFKLRDLL